MVEPFPFEMENGTEPFGTGEFSPDAGLAVRTFLTVKAAVCQLYDFNLDRTYRPPLDKKLKSIRSSNDEGLVCVTSFSV